MHSRRNSWLPRAKRVLHKVVRRPWEVPAILLRRLTRKRVHVAARTSTPAPSVSRSPHPIRPFAYPALRVAHTGSLHRFAGVLALTELDPVASEHTFDLLLCEPAPGEKLDLAEIGNWKKRANSVVLIVDHKEQLDRPITDLADLVVMFDSDIRADSRRPPGEQFALPPFVDTYTHHPTGWLREPPNEIFLVTDTSVGIDDVPGLAELAPRLHTFGSEIRGFKPVQHEHERPTGKQLAETAKKYRACLIAPALFETSTSYRQFALEVTASGTPVIASSPSPDLDDLLDGHYLRCGTPDELAATLEVIDDPFRRERLSIAARRHVLSRHTQHDRLDQILEATQNETNPPESVSILLATHRPEQVQHAMEGVRRQVWPAKELILILHDAERFSPQHLEGELETLGFPSILVACPADKPLGDCLNAGLDQATGTYVTKMDDDDHYGPMHLMDLMTATRYADASVIGKLANPTYLTNRDVMVDWRIGDQERFVHHIPGATMLVRRDLLERYRFSPVERGVDSNLWERMSADGHRLYSTHWLNFVRVRHGANTYVRSDQDFIDLATLEPTPNNQPKSWFV